MNEQNSYYAFISYNSADEKWAKWLQHNLEYYHIPSALCKEYPELPKKIRPVFWYKQDLSGTKLKKALNNELSSSKYLIVICSPDSAKADWVNDEVVAFIEQDKGDRIIPFIVAGTPHAKNLEEECFPPALRNLTRDEEIRGIDVRRKEGKSHALVDVIATMFGVRFDVLWQRHERRRKKIRNIWIAIASVFLLCALGVYDYNRVKVEYYADFVDCWGIARGIQPINKDIFSHRNRTYKFEYKRTPIGIENAYKWRIYRISYINSHGQPQYYNSSELTDRYPIVEYIYDDKGKLLKTININPGNLIVSEYHYSDDVSNENCVIDIVAPNTRNSVAFTSANNSSMNFQTVSIEKNTISRFILKRDSLGHIIKKTFHSDNRINHKLSRTCDYDGISGYKYYNDSLGRVKKIIFLDNNDDPINNRYGYGQKEYYYINNNLDSVAYKTKSGNLCKNEGNWAIAVIDYDIYGNFILEKYYDENLNLCYRERQIAQLKATYNNWGECIRLDFLSEDGSIKVNTELGYATCLKEYDSRGNQISESYHDSKGWNATSNQWGASKLKIQYDKNNRVKELSTYDVLGNLCLSLNNTAINRMCYYDDGLIKEVSGFDREGNPTNNKEGFHKIEYTYNKLGYLKETRYYDKNSELTKNINGFAIIKHTFDGQGNVCELAFFDEKFRPIKEKTANFAQKIVYEHDEYGRITSLSLYEDGTKILGTQNWHKVRYDYGGNGLISKYTYFNTNDSLCITTLGYSSSEYTYNLFGKPVNITNFCNDTILNIVKMEYNPRGQIIYWEIRNEQNRIEDKNGVSSIIYKYDLLGNQTYIEHRNKYNQLCVNKELKYSIFEAEYNNYGFLTYMAFYDKDKKLVKVGNNAPMYKAKYNGDKLQEVTLYSEDGKSLYMGNNGFAKRVIEYNEDGLTLIDSFYDTHNNLVVSSLGFALCKFIYDKNGNQVETIFYNEKMEEIMNL